MNVADKRGPAYQAYLLRLWRDGTQASWRASLQSTRTEQLYHFATLEALFAFLDGRLVEPHDGAASDLERAPPADGSAAD